jgi:hypothetical protein
VCASADVSIPSAITQCGVSCYMWYSTAWYNDGDSASRTQCIAGLYWQVALWIMRVPASTDGYRDVYD